MRRLKNKIQEVQSKIIAAERSRDLAKVADLRYGAIPELNQQLRKLTEEDTAAKQNSGQSGDRLLTEMVAPSDIADVVSRWTGIPCDRLTTTESDKLLRLEERLGDQVIGQNVAVKAVAEAISVASRASSTESTDR